MGIFVKEKKEDIFNLTPIQEHMNDVFLNEGEAGAEYIIKYIEESRLALAKDILKEMLVLKESVINEASVNGFVQTVKTIIDKFCTMIMNGWNKILAFYYKSATAVKTRFDGLEKYFELNKTYIVAGINQAKPIGTYNVLDMNAPILKAGLSIDGIGNALVPNNTLFEAIVSGNNPAMDLGGLFKLSSKEGSEPKYVIQDILEDLNMSDAQIKAKVNRIMLSKFITIDDVSDTRATIESEFKKYKMIANTTTVGEIASKISDINRVYNEVLSPETKWLIELNNQMKNVKLTMDRFKESIGRDDATEAEAAIFLQSSKVLVNKLGVIRGAILQNVTTYSSITNKYVSDDINTWATILTKLCAIGKDVEKKG